MFLVFAHHASKTGISADGVVRVVSESSQRSLDSALGPVLAFFVAGHTGVTLFFILSAYLLARPFIRAHRAGDVPNVANFYHRRALRIIPAYGLAVLVATWATLGPGAGMLRAIPYLVFGQGFWPLDPMMPYSAVWWSLATEFQFYVVLPWIALCFGSRLGRGALMLSGLSWLFFYLWVISLTTDQRMTPAQTVFNISLLVRAPAFIIGAGLAWLDEVHGGPIRERLARSALLARGGADALVVLLLGALGLLLREVASMNFFIAELAVPEWHVPEALLWGGLFFLVVMAPVRLRGMLAGRVLGTLGLVSYSMYLFHLPLLRMVVLPASIELGLLEPGDGLSLPLMAIGFGLCLGVSALTYRFVERPFLLRKTRYTG
jgi:peptidoglycan/LPS O-acetylase OafA/YrhL